MMAYFCFYKCLASILQLLAQFLRLLLFLNFPFGRKTKSVNRNAVVSTRKCCLFVCFRLFWSDWETSGIHSVDKDTGGDMMTVAKGLDRPTAFVIFKATPPGL